MRKIICGIVLLNVLFLMGCNNGDIDTQQSDAGCATESEIETEDSSSEDMEKPLVIKYADSNVAKAYREVLKSEKPFISVDQGYAEVLLEDYNLYKGEEVEELWKHQFNLIDVDGDSNYEIAVEITIPKDDPLKDELLLVYHEGRVYGYNLPPGIYTRGGNVLGWINDFDNGWSDECYRGYASIAIENQKLKLTYYFQKPHTLEEKWLVGRE